jgi:hypothetical protein
VERVSRAQGMEMLVEASSFHELRWWNWNLRLTREQEEFTEYKTRKNFRQIKSQRSVKPSPLKSSAEC